MIEKLSSSLGLRGEEANIQCAVELVEAEDMEGIREIADALFGDKKRAHDCIKVMYEIGYRKPELIVGYVDQFIVLLSKSDNRMVWGAMCAISTISKLVPERLFSSFDTILKAYENGSVITRDCSITVFAELAKASPEYSQKALPVIYKHLRTCRPKEVAQHSERASICFDSANSAKFKDILEKRYSDLADPQKKRVDRVLAQLW